jgi:hypothetical protein
VWLWLAVNNYNQQTSKNNLKQKFATKSKPQRKNPIGKATTTKKKTEINPRKENRAPISRAQLAKILKGGIQNVVLFYLSFHFKKLQSE